MDYFVNVNEQNFSEVWAAAAQVPTVFHFISPREVASLEMDALLRRISDENLTNFYWRR